MQKFKRVIWISNPHWYLHSICISTFDTTPQSTELWTLKYMQQHLSPAQEKSKRILRVCPSPKGHDVDNALKTVLLLHHRLTAQRDPLPLCRISKAACVHLHMAFSAGPAWHETRYLCSWSPSRHLSEPNMMHASSHEARAESNNIRALVLETKGSMRPSSIRTLPEEQGVSSNRLFQSSAFRSECSG